MIGALGIVVNLHLRCVLSERIDNSRMLLGDCGLEHLETFQSRSIQSTLIPYVVALTALLIDIFCFIAFRVDAVV